MESSTMIRKILFSSLFTLTSAVFATTEMWLGTSIGINLGAGFAFGVVGSFAILIAEAQIKKQASSIESMLYAFLAGNSLGILTLMMFNFATVGITLPFMTFLQATTYLAATYIGYAIATTTSKKNVEKTDTTETSQTTTSTNKIILDATILEDSRFADLAASGLLNKQLVLPSFIYSKIREDATSANETVQTRAEKALETIEKLQNLPGLDLVISETENLKGASFEEKLEKLASETQSRIFTARREDKNAEPGTNFIDLHHLAKTLKPLMQSGSVLNVKIQMYGKQPRQGVGFLDDGTMVVVNGGSEFLGKTIKAFVLSEKPTSSGRMIFCNVMEDTTTRSSSSTDTEFTY